MSELIGRLRRYKDNRGLMAELRCALVPSKRHRAWPALSRLGVAVDDHVSSTVAGLYATNPDESREGNFGTTCRTIEKRRGESKNDDSKVTPTERRFQHLLSADDELELHQRVTRLVLLAKAQGISINYEQLERDLSHWSERTRTGWATSFWAPNALHDGDDDSAEVPL